MCSVTRHIYFYFEYGYYYNNNNNFVVIPKHFFSKCISIKRAVEKMINGLGLLFLT